MNRNRILFIRKNAPGMRFFLFCCYFLAAVVPRNLIQYIKNKEFSFIPVFLKSITWHFTNKPDSDNLGYPLTR